MAAPRQHYIIPVFVIFILIIQHISANSDDEFHEELFLKPLPSGHLYGHFQFSTKWNVTLGDDNAFIHYHLFPKSLGEVLAKYHVHELHLSLTAGLWRYEKWGYPMTAAPPGAELWVWFQEGTRHVDEVWTDLINVLSGMFCASLNFMDSKATIIPKYSFRPQGVTSDIYSRFGTNLVRYAALPRENVCTENLTPWKKLLPCGSKAGLASLLNAGKIYDTSYNSIGIHFRPVCQVSGCNETAVELGLNLGVVFEPPVIMNGKQDWSFRKLFGRNLASPCPLASTSKVFIDITSNKTLVYYFSLSPQPEEILSITRGGQKLHYAVYDIPQFTASHHVLNLAVKYNKNIEYGLVSPPVLRAHRFQTGYGQEKGGVTCLLYNNHLTKPLTVVYLEMLPWFLRTYLHTLSIKTYSSEMAPSENGTAMKPLYQHYIPGRDRSRPYQLELLLRLPPNSVTKLSIQFDRTLLTWTEYPPDANHGFYVNSAVISAVLPATVDYTAPPQDTVRVAGILTNKSSTYFIRLHTESLLVTLPTPDFSMPYNVICLACTAVAIAFGSIHNLTTRRFVVNDPTKKKGLLNKLKALFSRSSSKKKEKGTDEGAKKETDTAEKEDKKER